VPVPIVCSKQNTWESFIDDLVSYETMLRIQYVLDMLLYKALVTAQAAWS